MEEGRLRELLCAGWLCCGFALPLDGQVTKTDSLLALQGDSAALWIDCRSVGRFRIRIDSAGVVTDRAWLRCLPPAPVVTVALTAPGGTSVVGSSNCPGTTVPLVATTSGPVNTVAFVVDSETNEYSMTATGPGRWEGDFHACEPWTAAGPHELRARARTSAGQITESPPLVVTVSYGAPPPPVPAPSPPPPAPAIPELAAWESNMRTFGRVECDRGKIQAAQMWEGGVWYYDGERVFYQIADYTGDPFWNTCAQLVEEVYRAHVLANNGRVQGYRVFPHGLAMDFQRTGDPLSKSAGLALGTNSPWIVTTAPEWLTWEQSREVAYAINALTVAERDLGLAHNPQLDRLLTVALGHIDDWFVSKRAAYVKFGMVGLTLEALIDYYQTRVKDPRIPPAVQTALDGMWPSFNAPAAAFPYCNRLAGDDCTAANNALAPSPDLNLLIAPAYAWYWRHSGNDTYRTRGDALFAGGVRGAWLGQGKMFSQNYRWSFKYVEWRRGRPPA